MKKVFINIAIFYALLFFFFCQPLFAIADESSLFCVADKATPVLNNADFSAIFGSKDGSSLKFDASGVIREVEFIALEGTPFRIVGIYPKGAHSIYAVECRDYPVSLKTRLYIDSRFVTLTKDEPVPRIKNRVSKAEICSNLKSLSTVDLYVWGGNYHHGVPELFEYYAPQREISPALKKYWTLQGLDCSGLLYEATHGFTPRNTSELVHYGKALPIRGKTAEEIDAMLEPLDLIVWFGHVVIVLDDENIIESRLSYEDERGRRKNGVRIRPRLYALNEIHMSRKPVNTIDRANKDSEYVIRRWYE